MFKKLLHRFLPLLIVACIFAANFNTHIIASDSFSEIDKINLINRITAAVLEKKHYSQHEMDKEMSSKIFDEFFYILDPNKIFFTQNDISRLEKYRYTLGPSLINSGNCWFAMIVYELFKERFDAYKNFAAENIQNGFDFTVDENFVLDRSKEERAKNLAELKDVWRKKIKNDILTLNLIEQNTTAPTASNSANNNAEPIKKLTAEERVMRRFHDIQNEINSNTKLDIDAIFLTAAAQAYGPHSNYLSPKDEEEFDIAMRLSLFGIGAVLTTEDGYVKVVEIISGGPADLDGRLQPGDRIIAVAQQNEVPVDVIDMPLSKAVRSIRGPLDSKVTLTVLPGVQGRNAAPAQIELTRGKVEMKESEAQGSIKEIEKDGKKLKIGIIELNSFYMDFEAAIRHDDNFKSCSRDVRNILKNFNNEKVDGVIIDLRNNGGGSLSEAIELTGLFIKDGPVVQVRNASQKVEVKNDNDSNIYYDGPLILLNSKLTSSAAEIFSGAIKDYQRGIIMGDTRSYGKGTVLEVLKLDNLLQKTKFNFPVGSLKYEVALFYRINGESTQLRGIDSDIVFPSISEIMDIGEKFNRNSLPWDKITPLQYELFDPALNSKIKTLNEQLQSRLKNNQEYSILLSTIEFYKQQKARHEVSLNEAKRISDFEKEKKVSDQIAEMTGENDEPVNNEYDKSVKKKKRNDFMLRESVNVMADYIALSKK